MKSNAKPISKRVASAGGVEFHKLHTKRREWRDAYHWLLTLTWPQFSACVLGLYLCVNLLFSLCYYLSPQSIAGANPGSWADAFFFSVETLATVGYGHMYPQTLFGHVVATVEIMTGMFGMAIVTGLIFIRFSRPMARILFSQCLVLSSFDGRPALMFRVANLRDKAMVEAEFRLMLIRDEPTEEGEPFRRFYTLKLEFDRLIAFPAIITIRHIINEHSPLHGRTIADLERGDSLLSASIVCIDTVIPAPVQSHHIYSWRDIRVNHRFVDVYSQIDDHAWAVDYSRIDATEPAPERPSAR